MIRLYLRPSSLAAVAECPARPAMEALAVEQCPTIQHIESPQAKQGLVSHGICQQAVSLIYHRPGGRSDPAGAIESLGPMMRRLGSWTVDAIRRCITYVVAIVEREEADGYDVAVECEMHLPGRHLGIERGGTADVVIICRDRDTGVVVRVIIVDYKYGFLDQGHAAEHVQLHTYGAMAWEKFRPVRDLEVHLAQGRLRSFTAALFTGDVIPRIEARIREIVTAAKAPDAPLRPCIAACRYCKALTLCRAARDRIMSTVHEAQLFGIDTRDRVKLADDAALAARFAEEARALAKAWVQENQGVAAEPAPEKQEEQAHG